MDQRLCLPRSKFWEIKFYQTHCHVLSKPNHSQLWLKLDAEYFRELPWIRFFPIRPAIGSKLKHKQDSNLENSHNNSIVQTFNHCVIRQTNWLNVGLELNRRYQHKNRKICVPFVAQIFSIGMNVNFADCGLNRVSLIARFQVESNK